MLQNRSFAQPFLVVCGCLSSGFDLVDFVHRASRSYYLSFNYLSYYLYVWGECSKDRGGKWGECSKCVWGECSWKTPPIHTSLWK